MTDLLKNRAVVPVACSCGWDDESTLTLVDVWKHEYPPIPYVRLIRFDGQSADYDPPAHGHVWCPRCEEELNEDTIVGRT